MESTRYIYWQDKEQWLGYLQDYPDYWTQGQSLEESQSNLRDLSSRPLLEVDFPQGLPVGVEPLDGFLETLAQGMAGLKPEEFFRPADIQAASRLPIGFGGI